MDYKRQERLAAIVADLQAIPGIETVTVDDFTDEGFWIFLDLLSGKDAFNFASPLRSIKANVKAVCRKHGIGMNFLDWPVMQYKSIDGRKYRDGYDRSEIKFDLRLWPTPPAPKPREVQLPL